MWNRTPTLYGEHNSLPWFDNVIENLWRSRRDERRFVLLGFSFLSVTSQGGMPPQCTGSSDPPGDVEMGLGGSSDQETGLK